MNVKKIYRINIQSKDETMFEWKTLQGNGRLINCGKEKYIFIPFLRAVQAAWLNYFISDVVLLD